LLSNSGRFTHISGHPSAAGGAQDRESSPVKDRRSTNCVTQPSVKYSPIFNIYIKNQIVKYNTFVTFCYTVLFMARQHTDARYLYRNSVCLSVCPSVHHTVAQSFWFFQHRTSLQNFERGHPCGDYGKWSRLKPEVEFRYGGRLFFENRNSYISAVNMIC